MHNGVVLASKAIEALQKYLEERGYHDHGKHEDTDWLQASATNGIGVLVLVGDELCGGPHDRGAEKIEGSIHQRGKDG